ncbi:hypothetical protein EYF80_027558 [Liparis tanakae]|uniref:Uncharacterized protein n=1 Tax=Liparis tanakae TaxID=230148 RepID=A0A4Z2H8G2_9TELE|nr:hypothetical protein EYF80_027558 [Liparis tanakae]
MSRGRAEDSSARATELSRLPSACPLRRIGHSLPPALFIFLQEWPHFPQDVSLQQGAYRAIAVGSQWKRGLSDSAERRRR